MVGGHNSSIGQFPHQVTLQEFVKEGYLQHHCGGSIIGDRWILTAGHCVFGYDVKLMAVKAGKHNINIEEESEQLIWAEKTFVHDKFHGLVKLIVKIKKFLVPCK